MRGFFLSLAILLAPRIALADSGFFPSAELAKEYRRLVLRYNKKTGARLISVPGLKKWMKAGKKLVILDVRQGDEYEAATLPGAILVAPDKKKGWPKLDLPKDAQVIAFCTIGYRAGCAARAYEERLGRKIYTLDGGLIQWFNEGGIVVDGAGKTVNKIDAYMPDLEKYVKARKDIPSP